MAGSNTNDVIELGKKVEGLINDEKYKSALPFALQWITNSATVYGDESTNFATAITDAGIIYEELGNYTAAEPLYKAGLAIREKTLGVEHLDTADSMNNLGMLYRKTGEYPAAEQMYQQSLKIRMMILGAEHADTGDSLNNLAVVYRNMGDYAAAEPLYQQSLSADGQNQPLRVESKPASLRDNYWSKLSPCESATDERTQIEPATIDFSIK